MPRLGGSDGRAQVGAALRAASMVVGIGFATAAAWLLVTADTTKNLRIGALLGLWGLLLCAYAMLRRHEIVQAQAGGELVVRSLGGLDTLTDAAAVRAYEQRLQAMLRHEIQQTLGVELANLRAAVAALRSE